MPYPPREARAELLALLVRTRRDWKMADVNQVINHCQHLGWTWPQILTRLPATAAEEGSRPGDVLTGGWNNPNGARGTAPSQDYRDARAALPYAGRQEA